MLETIYRHSKKRIYFSYYENDSEPYVFAQLDDKDFVELKLRYQKIVDDFSHASSPYISIKPNFERIYAFYQDGDDDLYKLIRIEIDDLSRDDEEISRYIDLMVDVEAFDFLKELLKISK